MIYNKYSTISTACLHVYLCVYTGEGADGEAERSGEEVGGKPRPPDPEEQLQSPHFPGVCVCVHERVCVRAMMPHV